MAYAAARKFMVDGQLRPNKVTDPLVLAAMARLEREAFVPAAAQARAYADEAVPLAPGRLLCPAARARPPLSSPAPPLQSTTPRPQSTPPRSPAPPRTCTPTGRRRARP